MAKLSGGRFLADLNHRDPAQGALFQKIIDALNHSGEQNGVDPVKQRQAPPPPDAVDVTVIGEQAHIRVTDNNPTKRSRTYFTEVHTDANYASCKHVEQHGATRDAVIPLPTLNSAGTMQAYYMRTFCQEPGSPPSPTTNYPTYVTMDPSGTTQGDLPPSAGSGTGRGNQSAQGFGKFPKRDGRQG